MKQNQKRALFVTILFAIVGTVLISCYTVPQTGRTTINLMDPRQEAKLGADTFEEIKKKEKVSTDAKQIEMVQRVGKRIADVADQDIPNAKWEFVLFENKEPNAFALPGGKVGVYTGIFEITKDDTGLATVLGHEIAHAAARHGSERISELQIIDFGAGITAFSLSKESSKNRRWAMIAYGAVATLGAILPHSRLQESEADHIGLIYMAKAGYPPKEAVAFWQRFREYNEKKGGAPPTFLSTHPADEERIADLEKLIPQAEVYYKTSGKKD